MLRPSKFSTGCQQRDADAAVSSTSSRCQDATLGPAIPHQPRHYPLDTAAGCRLMPIQAFRWARCGARTLRPVAGQALLPGTADCSSRQGRADQVPLLQQTAVHSMPATSSISTESGSADAVTERRMAVCGRRARRRESAPHGWQSKPTDVPTDVRAAITVLIPLNNGGAHLKYNHPIVCHQHRAACSPGCCCHAHAWPTIKNPCRLDCQA